MYVRNASFIVRWLVTYADRCLAAYVLRIRSRFRGSVDGRLFSFSSSFFFFFFSPSSGLSYVICVYMCVWMGVYVLCFIRLLYVSCCARERTFSSRWENGLFSFVYLT